MDRLPQVTRAPQVERAARGGAPSVVMLGLHEVPDSAWDVLTASGVRLEWVGDVAAAVDALDRGIAHVVVADARHGPRLARVVRTRPELAAAHIVICAALDSPRELRKALDAGADDVMRVPFEPEVLLARVTAGLRAARLRANEALLASLVNNVPGAIYRCDCDSDWTMQWLSPEIEELSGFPASDFIGNATRTFASIIHPDDRGHVERSIMDAVAAHRPFTLEYRIQRRDGTERWVLERGQAQTARDGRSWLDGAMFDITIRRAAEQALRTHEIAQAQLAEVRESRARIIEAADRARRDIERNLHDGAQQRLVSVALRVQLWLTAHADLPDADRRELAESLSELRAGLADLRALAQGLHPTVLTDRGLAHAVEALARRAPVPVDVRTNLYGDRPPPAVEAAAYFTVSEGLTNVAKYATAGHAWVIVEQEDGHLTVEIGDDGHGGADENAGSGLQGLRDRVAAVSGTLTVRSPAGGGTVLRARIPLGTG
jgi:PAS domain S-box-containing protein